MTSTPENPAPQPAKGRLKRRLARAALDFEAGMLELLVEREPEKTEHLVALAGLCARMRRYRRGLEVARALVDRDPADPEHRYRLACTQSLSGDVAGSCETLLEAIRRGLHDSRRIERDPDLRRLRDDPCFVLVRDALREGGE